MSFQNCKIICADANPADYHKQEAERGFRNYTIGRGELMEFMRCPHRWKAGYRDGDATEATEWGSLIDCLLLTPKRFGDAFAVAPKTYMADGKKKNDPPEEKPWNWNATFCKEWRAAQDGKTVIRAETKEDADKAVAAIKADSEIAELLKGASFQVWIAGEWCDKVAEVTVPVKALIDIVSDCGAIADLKTVGMTAAPSAWGRLVYQRGYDVQAAWYLDMLHAAGDERGGFLHVVQESFKPWEVGKRELSQDFIRLGRERYIEAMNRYCQCLVTENWPKYDNGWTVTEPEGWMVMATAKESTGGQVSVADSLTRANL